MDDFHRVGIDETAAALDDRDAETVEQLPRLRRFNEPDLALVFQEVIDVCFAAQRQIDAVQRAGLQTRERERRFAQVLLGMVPVLIAAPPTAGHFSTSATFLPSSADVFAAAHPAGPAPITTTSNCRSSGMGMVPYFFARGGGAVSRVFDFSDGGVISAQSFSHSARSAGGSLTSSFASRTGAKS